MSSPPVTATAPMPNPPANAERSAGFLHPKVVAREAAKVLADLGLEIRPAKVRLLVKRFIESGHTDTDFRTWFLGYADPTGEAAVAHVTAERGY